MRFIPRKSKVKIEFLNNFSLTDLIIAVIGFFAIIAFFFANLLPVPYNIYLALSFLAFWVTLYINVSEDVRLYYGLVLLFKFSAYKKKYYKNPKRANDTIERVIPYSGISLDKFIKFDGYYAMVIEIFPMSFGLLNEEKQDRVIDCFGAALQRLSTAQKATIIKTKSPMVLDGMVKYEDYKYNTLIDMSEMGLYNETELEARGPIFEERISAIRFLNEEEKVLKSHYYFVIYDSDREALEATINGIVASLEGSATPIFTHTLTGDELFIFLKSTFTENFDERDLEVLSDAEKLKWTYPEKLTLHSRNYSIDDHVHRAFTVTDYPIEVPNAWLYPLFAMEEAKVVVNLQQLDKYKAEKLIDKGIMEMEIRMRKLAKASKQIENKTHYDTLKSLLQEIKTANQNVFNVGIQIIADDKAKKEVRAVLRQNGFRFSENYATQVNGFVSASISRTERCAQHLRGIQTNSLSAMFPFISNTLQDERGLYLGYNQYPVFANFFMRNNERVNSNIMVIGKSGSGKSFATKTLLANFASDNTRVFILDPENEYEILCKNLRGKMIDVGSSVNGIFNPFHIYASLQSDEGIQDDSYSAHLQFLEQFYRIILAGINTDAFERLNSLTVELYAKKGIDPHTKLDKLEAKDYPIFDDLMELIDEKIAFEKEEYDLKNLQTIRVYMEKFATGGRNSNLWNGPTSIKTNENFICFNFRSLIANRNDVVANAQMLLVFKYLDNEIIKNREFNLKYFRNEELEEDHRRVIVAVDEAHVFINKKFPIALDFMAQMAKRIRKYNGMQIIITQNIKDFVGSEDIIAQSTAVINACQYSLIMSLAPNDINDLIALYRNAGGINEEEQDSIVTARRGQAFIITGPMNRTTVQIEALNTVRTIFENPSYLEEIQDRY